MKTTFYNLQINHLNNSYVVGVAQKMSHNFNWNVKQECFGFCTTGSSTSVLLNSKNLSNLEKFITKRNFIIQLFEINTSVLQDTLFCFKSYAFW